MCVHCEMINKINQESGRYAMASSIGMSHNAETGEVHLSPEFYVGLFNGIRGDITKQVSEHESRENNLVLFSMTLDALLSTESIMLTSLMYANEIALDAGGEHEKPEDIVLAVQPMAIKEAVTRYAASLRYAIETKGVSQSTEEMPEDVKEAVSTMTQWIIESIELFADKVIVGAISATKAD